MVDWSKLPLDIIGTIANRLDAVEDFIAFSAVCRSWRSFYLAKQWTPGSQIPWLMLSEDENSNTRSFFSLYRYKKYEIELPEARGHQCCGSPDGWLVTMGSDFDIHLLNIFTRRRIRLPEQSMFQLHYDRVTRYWYNFIDKAIVMKKQAQPTADEEGFLVMAIYGHYKQLAFTKPGYASWINVKNSLQYNFKDVAFLNDQIFVLCDMGSLYVVDIDSQPPKMELIASLPYERAGKQLFLVESSGNLLMVFQYQHVIPYKPTNLEIQFEVYKVDFVAKDWKQLQDLGDQAIFLGDNYSWAVDATKFRNCRGNSIYFTRTNVDHYWPYNHFPKDNLECDYGVYNMAYGTTEIFYLTNRWSLYSRPVWVTPTLR